MRIPTPAEALDSADQLASVGATISNEVAPLICVVGRNEVLVRFVDMCLLEKGEIKVAMFVPSFERGQPRGPIHSAPAKSSDVMA